jgi:dihydroorotate dehydrogenase (NAD+) catalytic subunit
MMAGATAIQIGTINFSNPLAGKEIIKGIEEFLVKEGIKDINDIIGIAKI